MNKKSLSIFAIIGIIVVIIAFSFVGSYNSITVAEEKIESEYSNINIQLERRADLIPNLVKVVKGYTNQEEKIIKEITDARKEISNASNIKELSEANNNLESALSSLNLIVENYPDLKSSENFINLQDELAGTENRISVARRDYNQAVKEYNTLIKKIPTNIIASIAGKEKANYFEIPKEKTNVPDIEF